ncbi:uncharacterized protein LOC110449400 [Mizuhopecten yessoensis]|uniref:uncharacterized protein LOC110449400 n=1 Tax=Mizuhopecten yessoensis TaxID=6573 RepID=UPI000B457A0B|nr:uncharacterized protein LOC110449400 [Mizuhopecten yessoensis]
MISSSRPSLTPQPLPVNSGYIKDCVRAGKCQQIWGMEVIQSLRCRRLPANKVFRQWYVNPVRNEAKTVLELRFPSVFSAVSFVAKFAQKITGSSKEPRPISMHCS